jgi:deoxycytidylate deaminase
MNKWDHRFMKLAQLVSTWSKDPDVQVGAAVRGSDNRVLSVGFNGFPAVIKDQNEWLNDKETKRLLTVHAEVNALICIPKVEARSATLYVTRPPCIECAKFIVAQGLIGRVICPPISPNSSWQASCMKGEWLMAQANIRWEGYHALDNGS